MLHILLYGREARIKKAAWRLGNGELTEYPAGPAPFIYSLLKKNASFGLGDAWRREDVIQTYLSISQREQDYRLAALNTYPSGKAYS